MLPVLGFRRRFSPGTPVSSTSYNWLVTTWQKYGRNSDEKLNSKTYDSKMRRDSEPGGQRHQSDQPEGKHVD